MPGTYSVEHSDPTKTPISIQPLGVDMSTSLTLLGYRSPVYQEAVWTNFLQMLEHFARNSPPIHPIAGQIWLDTGTTPGTPKFYGVDNLWHTIGAGVYVGTAAPTNSNTLWYNPITGGLYYYDGTAWINTVCIAIAGVCEYDELVMLINGDATATGQALIAPAPTPDTVYRITDAQWQTLINRVKQLAFTKAISTDAINAVAFNNYRLCSDSRCGLASVLSEYSKLQTLLNSALASTSINPLCFETLTPPTGAASRATPWTGTISHVATLTWADAAAASRFFNTGGKIVWNGSLTNPTNANDTAWQTDLASIPNVTVTKSNTTQGATVSTVGFEDLTASNQVMYTHSLGGYYTSTASTQIQGKVNASGNVLTLTISFNTSDTTSGVLASGLSFTRVGALCYNNPVVAYPASSSVGIA